MVTPVPGLTRTLRLTLLVCMLSACSGGTAMVQPPNETARRHIGHGVEGAGKVVDGKILVPYVIGICSIEAQRLITSSGLRPLAKGAGSRGVVYSQEPMAGVPVPPGATVALIQRPIAGC